MGNNKLNFYFFGDTGHYDRYNPAYVCNKEYAPEIIYKIASNDMFTLDRDRIIDDLGVSENIFDDIIENLRLINAIEIKNNKYRVKFPIFLESDVLQMEEYLSNIGETIGEKVISLSDLIYEELLRLGLPGNYNKERILYHIICDKIFDDIAFEFFNERDIFCTSKLQPGNRDYIIVAYEDSEMVESHSDKLLCSSNNYKTDRFIFNSFGDSNGSRKDMFRYFRMVQSGLSNSTTFNNVNSAYVRIIDGLNKDIAKECGELLYWIINHDTKYNELDEKQKNLLNFLKELEYVNINDDHGDISISVPVFFTSDIEIKNSIGNIILSNIYPIVKDVFESFEINASNCTFVRHKVDIKEVANELWHQIFGATNEYLVKKGFVEKPQFTEGEGRYLRSLWIS